MYHVLFISFIHSPISWYLGCAYLSATVDNVALNIYIYI
jgi:hypothetical protein